MAGLRLLVADLKQKSPEAGGASGLAGFGL
jgi:hypothetical protein